MKSLLVTSDAFKEGGNIPIKYTCDGENVSPQVVWKGFPPGTQAFVIIVDDPDAPGETFTHWILFNIPASISELPEGITDRGRLDNSSIQGRNSAGRIGYFGPCPPEGSAHRYIFTVFAQNKSLDLTTGATKQQVLKAMAGGTLAQGSLTGLYQRRA